MVPVEQEFGWSRSSISIALSINLLLYGLVGPFAAAVMDRFGIRRITIIALILLALGSSLTTWMQASWQLTVLWGVVVGLGSGCTASVLGAMIANRWFVKQRGLVMGILTASGATGQLVFLPLIASLAEYIKQNPFRAAVDGLVRGSRSFDFWLLAGSFFICGLSTNGLIGTHFIAACMEYGIPAVTAASLLALIGIFDIIGMAIGLF